MREFGKWTNKHRKNLTEYQLDMEPYLRSYGYDAWKAALEWVIREYYESNRALGSIVNEELEEK